MRTQVITRTAALGPSRTAVSTPPDQVPGGAPGNGEVEHLGRKDERGGQAKHRHLARLKGGADLAQGNAYPRGCRTRGEQRRLRVQEAVRQMHVV